MKARLVIGTDANRHPIEVNARLNIEAADGLVRVTFPDFHHLTLVIDRYDLVNFQALIETQKEPARQ